MKTAFSTIESEFATTEAAYECCFSAKVQESLYDNSPLISKDKLAISTTTEFVSACGRQACLFVIFVDNSFS